MQKDYDLGLSFEEAGRIPSNLKGLDKCFVICLLFDLEQDRLFPGPKPWTKQSISMTEYLPIRSRGKGCIISGEVYVNTSFFLNVLESLVKIKT